MPDDAPTGDPFASLSVEALLHAAIWELFHLQDGTPNADGGEPDLGYAIHCLIRAHQRLTGDTQGSSPLPDL